MILFRAELFKWNGNNYGFKKAFLVRDADGHASQNCRKVRYVKFENWLKFGVSMTTEETRLQESNDRQKHWKRWGPYLSECAWARCARIISPMARRGIICRTIMRDPSIAGTKMDSRAFPIVIAYLLRARVVEWARSGVERTPLRSDGQRRQSRRGCERVLLLSRLDADPFLHEVSLQVSASRVPLRTTHRGEQRERQAPAPEFELMDTGVFDDDKYFDCFVEYAKADVEDILIKITIANRGAEDATINVLPTVWFRNTWSWDSSESKVPGSKSVSSLEDSVQIIEFETEEYGQAFFIL